MTQLSEAAARYHKILEADSYRDLAWAEALRQRMNESGLVVSGKPVCPVLRPHFVAARQFAALTKSAETLMSALHRVKQMTLATPGLQARMEMLPAEKMLASIDPGYSYLTVSSLLQAAGSNGTAHFVDYTADSPLGVGYGEVLANLFLETGPVKEFKKKFGLTKMPGAKALLQAMLRAFKGYGGKKVPNIAIVEFKQPFLTLESAEYHVLAEAFRKLGYPTEVVNLDQLEYKNGVLRRGEFTIDLVYRCLKVNEFLIRYDLTHPLVRAYREHAICMVNSFRAELARRKAIYELLTDDQITHGFPAAEKKVLRESIPWTRMVRQGMTAKQDQQIDLVEYIQKNRESLVLRPNDDATDQHEYRGWEMDETAWERALKTALRNPYVVQERQQATVATFPVYQWGAMEMKQLRVDVHPNLVLGKMQGCSSWVAPVESAKFSSLTGVVPTFVIGGK